MKRIISIEVGDNKSKDYVLGILEKQVDSIMRTLDRSGVNDVAVSMVPPEDFDLGALVGRDPLPEGEETLAARMLRAAHRGHADEEGRTDERYRGVCASYLEEGAEAIERLQRWIEAFAHHATPEDLEAWKRTALFVSQPDFFERLDEALDADRDGMTSEELRAYLGLVFPLDPREPNPALAGEAGMKGGRDES